MAHLSVCLLYYIHDRMTNVPAWKDIKVGNVHVYHCQYIYIIDGLDLCYLKYIAIVLDK